MVDAVLGGTVQERQSPDWQIPERPFGRMAFPGMRAGWKPALRRETQEGGVKPPLHADVAAPELDVEEPVVGVGGATGLDGG
jgi:hypothetical protein